MKKLSFLLLPSPLLLLLAKPTLANPTNSYPLVLQYPPLAQQGVSYEYTLPYDTFTTSNGNLQYSAEDLPDWLAFDASSRTFSGTPSSASTTPGKFWFSLVGTDDTGSTSVNSSLALTNSSLATTSADFSLSEELESVGQLADSSTLVLKPNETFYLAFPASAFNGSEIVQYIAMTQSHTPLPIWINYDSSALSFSGTTPSASSEISSQTYALSLMAIQSQGFSSCSIPFNLKISVHEFTTNVTYANQTAEPKRELVWNVPLDKMNLDGSSVSISDIANVTVSPQPDWLTVNSSEIALQGTVPADFSDQNYTVTVTSIYSDAVQITLNLILNSTTTIFNQSSLAAVNATTDDYFIHQLPVSATNANISVTYSPAASWLSFNQSNMTFSGNVPSSFSGTTATLVNENDASDSLSLTIRAVNSTSSTTSTTPIATSSSSSATTSSSTEASHSSGISKKTIAIICGTVIPICAIIFAVLLFFCCRARKSRAAAKARQEEINPDGVEPIEKPTSVLAPSVFTIGGGNGSVYPSSYGAAGHPVYGSTDKFSMYSTPALTTSSLTPIMHATISNPGLKKDWDSSSPAKATEFNLFKLDNPKLPAMDFGDSSPISNSFSDASDTTHVGDDSARTTSLPQGMSPLSGFGLGVSMASSPLVLDALANPSPTPAATGTAPAPASSASPLPPQTPTTTTATPIVATPSIPPRAALRTDESSLLYPAGKPRNSWRQQTNATQDHRRWHSRTQGGSLASIGTDELISVRMVATERHSADIAAGLVPSSIGRENSSPILRALGGDSDSDYSSYAISELNRNSSDMHPSASAGGDMLPSRDRLSRHTANSGSIGSYSSSEGSDGHTGSLAVPYGSARALGVIAESPKLLTTNHHAAATVGPPKDQQQQRKSTDSTADRNNKQDQQYHAKADSGDTYEMYRTASSGHGGESAGGGASDGDSGDDFYDEAEVMHPVKRNGEWDWEKVAGPRTPAVGYSSAENTPVVGGRHHHRLPSSASIPPPPTPVLYGQAIDSPTIDSPTIDSPIKVTSAPSLGKRRQSGHDEDTDDRSINSDSTGSVRLSNPGGIRKVS